MNIKPFKAYTPKPDIAHLAAVKSYVLYSTKELTNKLMNNPYSFLHVMNPEFGKQSRTRANSNERFELSGEKFHELCDEQVYLQADKPCFFVYRQSEGSRVSFGIIGSIDLKHYQNNEIKKHEETLVDRVDVFSRYLDICGINADPVLLTYPSQPSLKEMIENITKEKAEIQFETDEGIMHELWKVDDESTISNLQKELEKIEEVYIADGHHRCASSYALYEQKNFQEEYRYCMAFITDLEHIEILPYHRGIKYDEEWNVQHFEEFIEANYIVKEVPLSDLNLNKPYIGDKILCYMSGLWHSLELPPKGKRAVDQLDSSILHNRVLKPYFKIEDPSTDQRLFYIDGKATLNDLSALVDSHKASVCFALPGIQSAELLAISDEGSSMYPKSTWIEPKLLTGLTISEY